MIPTVTLVEDATHLSEFLEAETNSVTLKIDQQCDYNAQQEGTCSISIDINANAVGFSTAELATASGTISLAPVALDTGSGSKSASVSAHSFMAIPIVAAIVSGAALLVVA